MLIDLTNKKVVGNIFMILFFYLIIMPMVAISNFIARVFDSIVFLLLVDFHSSKSHIIRSVKPWKIEHIK